MLTPRIQLPRPRPSLEFRAVRVLHSLWRAPTSAIGRVVAALGASRRGIVFHGPAASARLYEIRPGRGLDWVGAVTLGQVILHRRGLFEGPSGQLILAHELAHTRQHDVLGPLYLPLHLLAQAGSALLSLGSRPVFSRVHDRNPLEQTFICLGASACHPGAFQLADVSVESMLRAFGLLPSPGNAEVSVASPGSKETLC